MSNDTYSKRPEKTQIESTTKARFAKIPRFIAHRLPIVSARVEHTPPGHLTPKEFAVMAAILSEAAVQLTEDAFQKSREAGKRVLTKNSKLRMRDVKFPDFSLCTTETGEYGNLTEDEIREEKKLYIKRLASKAYHGQKAELFDDLLDDYEIVITARKIRKISGLNVTDPLEEIDSAIRRLKKPVAAIRVATKEPYKQKALIQELKESQRGYRIVLNERWLANNYVRIYFPLLVRSHVALRLQIFLETIYTKTLRVGYLKLADMKQLFGVEEEEYRSRFLKKITRALGSLNQIRAKQNRPAYKLVVEGDDRFRFTEQSATKK